MSAPSSYRDNDLRKYILENEDWIRDLVDKQEKEGPRKVYPEHETFPLMLSDDREIEVQLNRDTRRKHAKMWLDPDGTVRIAASIHTPLENMIEFAKAKKDWIEERLERPEMQTNPEMLTLEGEQVRVIFEEAPLRSVKLEAGELKVSGPNQIVRRTILKQWWSKRLYDICAKYVDKWIPKVLKPGEPHPHFSITKTHSRWGSCTPAKNTIRFSYYLLCVPEPEIEYVVLHELAHLLYHGHQKDFWAFMSRHMPDWESRRRILKDYSYCMEGGNAPE